MSSSPSQDTFLLHHRLKRNPVKMSTNIKSLAIVQIICDLNSQQPFPERTLKPDPAGHPISIGRASTNDKNSKYSTNNSALANPENAKFVCSVMSKNHAQLIWINNRPHLQDTASTHGTWYMPSQRVQSSPALAHHTSPLQNPRTVWQKIPNPLPLHDGITIRFGRAITNPDNGLRHTPLQVTFRIPQPTNALQPGTYGLHDSQKIDSSDESETEEVDPKEAPSVKVGPENSPRTNTTSNNESLQTHPGPSQLIDYSGVRTAVPKPLEVLDHSEPVPNCPSTAALAVTLNPSKRSVHRNESPNSSSSVEHRSSQTSRRSGVPSNSHSQSRQLPVPSHKKFSGDSSRPMEATEPNNFPDHHNDHSNKQGRGHATIEKQKGVSQQTSDAVRSQDHAQVEHDKVSHDTIDNHLHIPNQHIKMEEKCNDVEEDRSPVQAHHSDAQQDSDDEDDFGESDDDVDSSPSENLQNQVWKSHRQQNGAPNHRNGENPGEGAAVTHLDESQCSTESFPQTSNRGVGSLITTSEEESGTTQTNQLLNSSSYKDVSVVTTITSKTKFTKSLNQFPNSLARTFQSHKLDRLVQSEPGNVREPNQYIAPECPPAAIEPQSPVLISHGTMMTTELKRKRSLAMEDREEAGEVVKGNLSTDGVCESEGEEDVSEKRLRKRVKRGINDENGRDIVCSHCSHEISSKGNRLNKSKFKSHILSVARSAAIFALGGVATVAGILAFENISDEL